MSLSRVMITAWVPQDLAAMWAEDANDYPPELRTLVAAKNAADWMASNAEHVTRVEAVAPTDAFTFTRDT